MDDERWANSDQGTRGAGPQPCALCGHPDWEWHRDEYGDIGGHKFESEPSDRLHPTNHQLEATMNKKFDHEGRDITGQVVPSEVKIGDRVIVAGRYDTHDVDDRFKDGAVFTVCAIHERSTDEGLGSLIGLKELGGKTFGYEWFDRYTEPSASSAPLIDFSPAGRAKAREYAGNASSTKLTADVNATLRAVANGEKVDALHLNAAIAQAFSLASTRYGNSLDRRQATAELRHLHYIVQAHLSNAVHQLPAFEPGERSPALAEAKAQIKGLERNEEALKARVRQVTDDLEAVKRTADAFSREADRGVSTQIALEAARDTALKVLGFALGQIEEDLDRERVLGFWDALEPGFRHEYDPKD